MSGRLHGLLDRLRVVLPVLLGSGSTNQREGVRNSECFVVGERRTRGEMRRPPGGGLEYGRKDTVLRRSMYPGVGYMDMYYRRVSVCFRKVEMWVVGMQCQDRCCC